MPAKGKPKPPQDPASIIPRFFGKSWPPGTTELQAALACFRKPSLLDATPFGKVDMFWFAVGCLWGNGAPKHFVRHPWAEQMAIEACRETYLAVSGCGSSGKTDFFAVWSLINWLCAPIDTKVLVTSTSLKESRKRIWGSVREYYIHSALPLPGKLLDSIGQIRVDADGTNLASDKAGIELVAGEKSKEKEAVGKLIGIKRTRVFLIADELPELPESLLEAAYGNLALNPVFQLVGIGNFRSTLDAFGVFCTPVDGWKSVNIETTEWRTRRGLCIRLDGFKSPNVLLGEDVWPIYGIKQLNEHLKEGENTAQFWRMCRSFPAPEGMAEYIYSEAELIAGDAFMEPQWEGTHRVQLAALDPAFTNDGDRPMLVFGWLGTASNGKRTLALGKRVRLQEDVRQASVPFDFQIVRAFQAQCLAEGVVPENSAFDATGSGLSFGSIVANEWSPRVLPVKFGGAASERGVSPTDIRRGSEAYVNRVSELWYQGREFIRAGQIRGVSTELAKELTSRKYEVRKDQGTRIVVEPKKDMKVRLGYSPDLADATMILLELARERFGFVPEGFGTGMVEEKKRLEENPMDRAFAEECFLEDAA